MTLKRFQVTLNFNRINLCTGGNFIKSAQNDDHDGDQFGGSEHILHFGGQFDTETVDKCYQT